MSNDDIEQLRNQPPIFDDEITPIGVRGAIGGMLDDMPIGMSEGPEFHELAAPEQNKLRINNDPEID